MPYQAERCVYPIEPYVEAMVEAKRRGLPVKLGLEVDSRPGREEETRALLEPYPWDYLLVCRLQQAPTKPSSRT